MSAESKGFDFDSELAYLRAGSVKLIALLVGGLGYLWLIWILWPTTGGESPLPGAWLGSGLLIASAVTSFLLRERHLGLSALLLVWGTMVAMMCGLAASSRRELAYLLILPIVFANVLLRRRGSYAAAAVAIAYTLWDGVLRVRAPLVSIDQLFPIAIEVAFPVSIMGAVAAASQLASRNLYTALDWVWHGYELAHHNELVARDRQAELRRTLKALDEATRRLERTNYMLGLARDQAEEARRLKQQFAQTISHELRTPLNLIVGFAELMTESPEYYGGSLPSGYQRDLNIVYRNACHLQDLVNDVLDLARIEAAQMSLVPEETALTPLVIEAVHTARSLIEARGLALHTDVEADLPRLWIDPTRVRQVLFNLLNNAARFTEAGSVTVSAHRRGGEVVLAVADTGVGIAQEDLARIFQEFQQADGTTRRQHGGAGLGLAISKHFVELHGGRIWVESERGQGSTFFFTLPLTCKERAVATRGRPAADRALGQEEPLLLAVVRSAAAATLLTRYVRGCRTVVVSDLQQARQTAQQLMPQAVLLDRSCVDLNGGRLEDLARAWNMPHTPFVLCPLPGEERMRQRLAVDGYLIKPVSRQSVWDLLRRFGQDVDTVLVIDDDQDFVLLVGRMLEDDPVRRYRVLCAYGGQEGLEMMRLHRPDLVLLDLMLPDLKGFEVIARMREDPAWRDIPVVIVSAQDELDDPEPLAGGMLVAKSEGLLPGEVMHWVQGVVRTTVSPLPTLQVPPEATAR
jgi:signal transduction histidine kinase/CheY-like chemotaxis protein